MIVDFERAGEILPAKLLADVRIVKSSANVKSCLPWNAIEVVGGQTFARIFTEGQGWAKKPIKIGKQGRYYVEVETPIPSAAIVKSKLW